MGGSLSAYDWGQRSPDPGLSSIKASPLRPSPAQPRGSPLRSPGCEYSDRLMPSRAAAGAASDLGTGFAIHELAAPENSRSRHNELSPIEASPSRDDENSVAYESLLRGELLGQSSPAPASAGLYDELRTPDRRAGLFKYVVPDFPLEEEQATPWKLRAPEEGPGRQLRKISKEPYKVLDAPGLEDDFYRSCLDNSSDDVLAVARGEVVDTLSLRTKRCERLCTLRNHTCTSLSWSNTSHHPHVLAVGRHNGEVQLWDVQRTHLIRTLPGHSRRVGALSWNGHVLATGSRDRGILLHDVRLKPADSTTRLGGHPEEICGLHWSPDGEFLASGGNEGSVCVWDPRSSAAAASPLHRFTGHTAAVRALAWSPHQRGLLASGGGTACKCIRFWSISRGTSISCMPTGSQVCNLLWSKSVNELVSTHGYSSNEIVLWKYPSMTRVATLFGHTARPLYLAPVADGQGIITGAGGDETIRFWNVFPGAARKSGGGGLERREGPSSLAQTIR